ncbi:MAG: DUF5658 family protein [Dehalococcoidia bacterium]
MKVLRIPSFLRIESRTVRYTLYVLFGVIVADGLLTQFLVTNGYGLEANPLLAPLVGGDSFLAIKVSAAFLATLFLWIKYNARPRLVYRTAVVALGLYTTIVYWNLLAFLLTAYQPI